MVNIGITSLYGGVLCSLYCMLSLYVGLYRGAKSVLFGPGHPEKNKILPYIVRAHANFMEYTPTILIMMALIEVQKLMAPFWLNVFGAVFVVTRVSHAYQLMGGEGKGSRHLIFRGGAFLTTCALLAIASAVLLMDGIPKVQF